MKCGESWIKSFIWRISGVFWLAFLTCLLTEDMLAVTGIALGHHFTCVFTYFLHERIWSKIKWALGKKIRSIAKSISYEIITCHVMIGLLTWFFTQEVQKMVLIPLIYVNSRIVMYYFYERVWRRFFSDN